MGIMPFFNNILTALLRRLQLLGPEIVRYNDLKAYNMVNSITLSTDMTTLYLIDNGRAIPFPLTKEKMILVGVLKGQVTVATSLAPDEMPEEESPASADPDISAAGLLRRGDAAEVKVPVSPSAQWTVLFNRKHQVMALIGAVEINPGLTPEKPEEPVPQIFTFNLAEMVIGIIRQGNALVFTPMRRGGGVVS